MPRPYAYSLTCVHESTCEQPTVTVTGMTDPVSDRAQYRRIADAIRQRIQSGQLEPGAQVPSEAELSEEFGVNRTTVRAAIAVLRNEGLIVTEHGRGSFVRSRPKIRRRSTVWYDTPPPAGGPTSPMERSIIAAGHEPSTDSDSRREFATEAVAERLGISVNDPVMRTDYTFRADGDPVMLSTSWEPLALTAGTPIELPEQGAAVGVRARFEHIGVHIDRCDLVVSTRPSLESEQSRLGMAPNVWVLSTQRTYRAGELVVETADIVEPGDRTEHHYGIPVS